MALFVIDPRERMANKLLLQGSASMDEVLFASFGAWPPAGLKIIGENNQRVNFMSVWQMSNHLNTGSAEKDKVTLTGKLKDLFSVAGRATLANERIIGVNKLSTVYLDRFLSLAKGNLWAAVTGNADTVRTTIAHESAHLLQGDHYWRAKEVFGHANSQKIWTDQTNASSNIIAKEAFDSHTKTPGILMRLFNKVSGSLGSSYYQQGIEIQARIHEVVSDGYQRWGTMPGNRAELYAALENAGLKVPEKFLNEIQKSPMAEDIEILFQSKKAAGNSSLAAADINFTANLLTDEGQDKFWDQTMPALYADLIEMYGDGPGRERFDLGTNPRREMRESADFIAAQKQFKTTPKQTQPA
jgi:hypothetical protein